MWSKMKLSASKEQKLPSSKRRKVVCLEQTNSFKKSATVLGEIKIKANQQTRESPKEIVIKKNEKKELPKTEPTEFIDDCADDDSFFMELDIEALEKENVTENAPRRNVVEQGANLNVESKASPKTESEINKSHEFNVEHDDLFLDDLFAGLNEDDFFEAEKVSKRLVVRSLSESSTSSGYREINVETILEKGKESDIFFLTLKDDWVSLQLKVGDTLNVIGAFDMDNKCVISNEKHLVIVHPDKLLSITRVTESLMCLRKAFFSERITGLAVSSTLFHGTLLHDLFEKALTQNDFSTKFLEKTLHELLIANIENLFATGEEEAKVFTDLEKKFGVLQSWAKNFLNKTPTANVNFGQSSKIAISQIVDIEEGYWSPKYGIKGKIDATVQVTTDTGDKVLAPLELKTGRPPKMEGTVQHRAQVILYNILMKDRYDESISNGLLYYLSNGAVYGIENVWDEIRSLLLTRNHLAHYLQYSEKLPDMIMRPYSCDNCYQLSNCSIAHSALEKGNSDSSGFSNGTFDEQTKHISEEAKDFFAHWNKLIDLEDHANLNVEAHFWNVDGEQREKNGKCVNDLLLNKCVYVAQDIDTNEDLAVTASSRRPYIASFSKIDNKLILNSRIFVGEYVILNNSNGQYGIASGYIVSISKEEISMSVDRNLKQLRDGVRYRIDKSNNSQSMSQSRDNLFRLLRPKDNMAEALRKTIIDKKSPKFTSSATLGFGSKTLSEKAKVGLNEQQVQAIERSIQAEDYSIILGMPGAGKTTVIAHLVKHIVQMGKTVYLASYTHTAVDNILLKLIDFDIDFLRVGNIENVHPAVASHVPNLSDDSISGSQRIRSVARLKHLYRTKKVVASTCYATKNPLFAARSFDYCIIDEASQITLPVCLGPLFSAKAFVLVGDHNQLPPLVRSEEAIKEGMEDTLFKILTEAHPSAVTTLSNQYRMNADISLLSSRLIYENKLKCATHEIATQKLDINLKRLSEGNAGKWIKDVLNPDKSVVFLNTDKVSSQLEERTQNAITNAYEAKIVTQLVKHLIECDIAPSDIGIITPYRAQISVIKKTVSE